MTMKEALMEANWWLPSGFTHAYQCELLCSYIKSEKIRTNFTQQKNGEDFHILALDTLFVNDYNSQGQSCYGPRGRRCPMTLSAIYNISCLLTEKTPGGGEERTMPGALLRWKVMDLKIELNFHQALQQVPSGRDASLLCVVVLQSHLASYLP